MDNDNEDEYFNKLCTQPPDDYDNIESSCNLPNLNSVFTCLATSDSTVTEDSASSSINQNCVSKKQMKT